MKPIIYLFTKDLRIADNRALAAALERSAPVLPCFILDADNDTSFAGRFLLESLQDLAQSLESCGGRLYILTGSSEDVLKNLGKQTGAADLYVETDFSPSFQELLQNIPESLTVHQIPNKTLTDPWDMKKPNGTPYQVYTHYLNKVKKRDIDPPVPLPPGRWYTEDIPGTRPIPSTAADHPSIKGGRSGGLKAVKQLSQLQSYAETRDFPSMDTSKLSPHIAYGTVSIREVYFSALSTFQEDTVFVNELIWRDFWQYIAFHYPHVFTGSFHRKFDNLPWQNNPSLFDAWRSGQTGFPLVDAGMRELLHTGFMHNRVRMVSASFLTKDLHIDWRMGEEHFASFLIDFDPGVNNGNWQWAASTGCDAQPFFRIFNPWTQQKRFDPQGEYIRRWIPELTPFSAEEIHHLEFNSLKGYPVPIVSHQEERRKALELYRSV